MKKRIIIIIPIFIILVTVGFFFWINRTVSTITIDINPSIKINLKSDDKVKKVIPLNEDAKDIVSKDLSGKTLDETIKKIADKVIENGYTDEDRVAVLVHTEGKVSSGDVISKIANSFEAKNFYAEIVDIKEISKEDQKLAKKYNITPAKAAYINAMSKENDILKVEDLVNKEVKELKEKERIEASDGLVCPRGYYEYNDTCYEETRSIQTDELECSPGFTRDEMTCTMDTVIDAEPVKYSCTKGEAKTRLELGQASANDGNAKEVVCIDYSNATHPVTPCELPASDPTERMSSGGRCYWHRAPVIAEGCPGKIQVAGECWDDATNIYICEGYRDGKQYQSKSEYCEHSIKYLDPIVTEYKCPDDYTLDGNKCKKTETQKAWYKNKCPDGYRELDNGTCIDESKTTAKVNGLVCDMPYAKLKDNTCIIYEIVEAKHN